MAIVSITTLIQGEVLSGKWPGQVDAVECKSGFGNGEPIIRPISHGIRAVCFAGLLSIAACSKSTDIADLTPTSATDTLTTASVSSSASAEDRTLSDSAVIASAIGGAKRDTKGGPHTMMLSWANEETGNSGTITAIEQAISADGGRCYSFLTTLESYTGISLYDGKACELTAGQWVLSWFKPKAIG
ncbi:MAG: RT0821/Lpp0805 family surface protein [Pseudomonadota bacterium]